MSNWNKSTLGELAKKRNGFIQTGPFGSQLHVSDYVDEGIPIIMPVNLKENKIDISKVSFISEKDLNRLSKHIVKSGDIIYSRRGDVTQKALITQKEEGYFCGTGCLLVRVGESINPNFLVYFLSTARSKSWILNHAVGITMPNLNTKILARFPISFPEKSIQTQIAKVLTDLDAKIEVNNKINQELEAMAKTLYDYWFVQFDFPTSEAQAKQIGNLSLVGKPYKSSGGKMVFNEELKREIPEGWGVDIIENLLAKDVGTKKIPSSEYLEKGKIPIIDQSTKFICGYTNEESSLIKTSKPRIVFGDHTRIVKLINFDFARGSDGTQVLLSNNERMPQHLFYHALLNVDLSNYGYARHFKFLKDTKLIIPHLEIAQIFEIQTQSFFRKIKHNIFENQKLSELRDWLLPMLMNGQVTVGSPVKNRDLGELEQELGMVAEDSEKYGKV
ncbi:restriction endonuclease subunit S [Gelidibacter pelagius]|uniref:Restriction endonuclease subunit S n=1 Tax=Gelidibacter pelagius TaxID=2819985 RepID=A0ABS3SRK9_9FLAO|nr:restriction endonuclease subunit S [Gelidibacter pelagius]MBO3098335.1 restriction endonuclease subunit S [Gelidibacter pelagius]